MEAPVPLTLRQAAEWRDQLDAQGLRLVFTSGCFDLLHAGHVRYLGAARALGDALLIALNSDDSVRALKGPSRPIHTAADRANVLLALRAVDAVMIFDEARTTALIASIRPHIFAKGGDYTVETLNADERNALHACGAEIHILPEVKGRSTTATLARLQKAPAAPARPVRLGVLGSGEGSNFEAIADAIADDRLAAEIAVVISDVADAPILAKAQARGIPVSFVDPGPWQTKLGDGAQAEIARLLTAAQVEYVICAGFMRKLKAPVLQPWANRILNIHPSLLPAFPGRDAVGQALAAGVTETGCSVHLVDDNLDSGAVVAQARVPVGPNDTAASLRERIHAAEHWLFPATIANFCTQAKKDPPPD